MEAVCGFQIFDVVTSCWTDAVYTLADGVASWFK
jgi:hypothetical protein